MPECRVYSNGEHLALASRVSWNYLARALFSDKPLETRLEQYGSRARDFKPVDSPADADLYLLPLLWNYYLEQDAVSLVEKEVMRAANAGNRLIVFSGGDSPANLPFQNVDLFESAGYASRRYLGGNRTYGVPAFIHNFLDLYCHGELHFRSHYPVPVVGFCGQAGGSWFDFARREAVRWSRQFADKRGWRKWEPAPYETTHLRKRILDQLTLAPSLQTNFLIRRRYRAGYQAGQKDPHHPTRLEFVQNILDSDYTLCVRGGGNFSVRFYETLALGRIPVFVNTDCILPYDFLVDYRQYGVWVEAHEISNIGEKILEFHQALSPLQFKELQMACYALWRDRLSMDGYFSHFMEHKNITS